MSKSTDDTILNVRLKADEAQAIAERAREMGVPKSEYMRLRALAAPHSNPAIHSGHDPVDFEQVMENILGAQEQFRDETVRAVQLQLTLFRQEVGDLFDALMKKLEADRARDSTRH